MPDPRDKAAHAAFDSLMELNEAIIDLSDEELDSDLQSEFIASASELIDTALMLLRHAFPKE